MCAGGGGPGQWSAVIGLRGSGPPLALGAPMFPPTGGGTRPSAALYGGGGCGSGGPAPLGGASRVTVPCPPHRAHSLGRGAWPSPPSSLVRGLGLRQWRVPPAVAPVGEGVAQSPGEPVVGIRIGDAEHRPPLQESWPGRRPVGPRRLNHRPEDPLVVLRGRPPPRGYLPVPPVPPEEHGIEGPVPHPPGGPQAGPAEPPVHLHHQGEGLIPQGVRDRAPVPVPGPGPPCPSRRLPLRPLCLQRQRRVPPSPPPRPRPSAPALPSARGGAGWCWGRGGFGGDEVAGVGSLL